MDPALAALDFNKAGAIIADMVASYFAATAPPFDPEGPDDHDFQDCRPTPVTAGLRLHPSIDTGASPLEPGEYGAPIQSVEQGQIARLDTGADSHPRPRSRKVQRSTGKTSGLQDPSQRCGDESDRCDLRPGSIPAGTVEPGLAPPARTVRHHRHARDRRGRLLRSRRVQRQPR